MKTTHKFLWRITAILGGFLAFGENLGAWTFEPDPTRYQDYRTEGIPAPKRLTTDGPGILPLNDKFIASVHSSFPAGGDVASLQDAISRGDYETAIRGAIKGMEKNAPWRVNQENSIDYGSRYYEFALVLANAYELNGDWRQALNVYASLYGDCGEEFTWAKTRILHATGDKQTAFKLICDATSGHSNLSVDSVLAKFEERRRELEEGRGLGLPLVPMGGNDSEWFALWKLRDQCARVICPELHYVKYLGADPGQAQRQFEAMQKEAFEKFLAFMEEELAASDKYAQTRNRSQVELLKSLRQIPYTRGRAKGM